MGFGGSGLAGILERLVGGKAANIGPDLTRLGNAGAAEDQFGSDLTNEGLGDLRGLRSDYQNQIGTGGLPDSIRQQFRIARGALADQSTRNQRDFSARLKQRFLTSGGTLSPTAQTEYDLENQKQNDEGLFSATNDLNAGEANLALTNTNALYSRLEGIGRTITGVGQGEKDRALDRIKQSLLLRFSRNKAISDAIMSYFSIAKGGGGTPSGGLMGDAAAAGTPQIGG
jgi:hypothetical protein